MQGFTYPTHWIQGALLDLRRYADGSFDARLLGEDAPVIRFANKDAAQAFISSWYVRSAARVSQDDGNRQTPRI